MKFFDKLKTFIKKIFVDYGAINKTIEEHSRIASKEATKSIIEYSSNNMKQITNEFNEKISIISKDLENLYNTIDRNTDSIEQVKNSIFEINQTLEKFKYTNFELQNIKLDEKNKNILIVGFYGAPNLGDELMLETLLDYLENIPNKKITILIADNPNYSIDKYKDVRFLHYLKNLCDFNVLAEQYDYVIFGGGAIIDDKQYEKPDSYQYDLGTILIKLCLRALAFNKKVICIALSASKEINNQEYLEKLKYIIQNATYFSVRDLYTKQYLEEQLGDEIGNKVIKVNDIVFSNKNILSNIRKENNNNNKILNIGIIGISNNHNVKKLKMIIEGISKLKKQVNINLIPFYEYNNMDTLFYSKVLEQKNNNVKINIEKYSENMKKIIELYNKNDIIIGMRYHSILLSHILNIPCISICYDIHEHYPYKIKYLNEMFNQGQALSYKNMKEEDIFNKLVVIIENIKQNNIRSISEKIAIDSRNQMYNIIEAIIN